jgi:anti-sigma factor RsiW
MIDQDTQLKLQASLDGELSAVEERAVTERLERDPEARAEFAELERATSLLAVGEMERSLPESREFYWSKIERALVKIEEPAPAAERAPLLVWWLKWLVPAAVGVALVCLMAPLLRQGAGNQTSLLSEAQEIETSLQQASFISFRSEADGMSVVWVDTHSNY